MNKKAWFVTRSPFRYTSEVKTWLGVALIFILQSRGIFADENEQFSLFEDYGALQAQVLEQFSPDNLTRRAFHVWPGRRCRVSDKSWHPILNQVCNSVSAASKDRPEQIKEPTAEFYNWWKTNASLPIAALLKDANWKKTIEPFCSDPFTNACVNDSRNKFENLKTTTPEKSREFFASDVDHPRCTQEKSFECVCLSLCGGFIRSQLENKHAAKPFEPVFQEALTEFKSLIDESLLTANLKKRILDDLDKNPIQLEILWEFEGENLFYNRSDRKVLFSPHRLMPSAGPESRKQLVAALVHELGHHFEAVVSKNILDCDSADFAHSKYCTIPNEIPAHLPKGDLQRLKRLRKCIDRNIFSEQDALLNENQNFKIPRAEVLTSKRQEYFADAFMKAYLKRYLKKNGPVPLADLYQKVGQVLCSDSEKNSRGSAARAIGSRFEAHPDMRYRLPQFFKGLIPLPDPEDYGLSIESCENNLWKQ